MENISWKQNLLDQDWADHAVVFKYRDRVMNQWMTVFLSIILRYISRVKVLDQNNKIKKYNKDLMGSVKWMDKKSNE